jgi:hypothetical protein
VDKSDEGVVRTWCTERMYAARGEGNRAKLNAIVFPRIIIPPLAVWHRKACDEPEDAFVELEDVILEADSKCEAIPGALAAGGEGAGFVARRAWREGRGECGKGDDVTGEYFGGCLPVVEGEADCNLFLEGEVADEEGAGENGRWRAGGGGNMVGPGGGEVEGLEVDVGVGRGVK